MAKKEVQIQVFPVLFFSLSWAGCQRDEATEHLFHDQLELNIHLHGQREFSFGSNSYKS